MTPETRAARDRIAAYLDARYPGAGPVITHVWPKGPKAEPVDLLATDLRTVLAALDQQPDRVLIIPDHLSEHAAQIIRERLADEWGALPADPNAP